jgi:hypothetical protein
MRRHLLQDLERQWLDAWRVVGQAQGDADAERQAQPKPPASTASGPARLPAEHGEMTGGRSAELAKPLPGATADADTSAPARKSTNEIKVDTASSSHCHDNGPQADASRASAVEADTRFTELVPSDQIAPVTANAVSAQGMSDQPAKPTQAGAEDGGRDAEPVAGLPVFANPILGNGRAGQIASFSLLTTPSMEARMAAGTSLEQPIHLAEAALTGASRTPAGGAPNVSNGKLEDGPETDASGAARQAKPPPTTLDDQGPQRIMLRELSDQEVLASMRDSVLTPTQSQFAAQGLALALMEAGYARVQVVVNGKPALTTQANTSTRVGDQPSGSRPTTVPQDKHHGQ